MISSRLQSTDMGFPGALTQVDHGQEKANQVHNTPGRGAVCATISGIERKGMVIQPDQNNNSIMEP